MIADLHCHYPMHVLAGDDHHRTLARMARLPPRPFADKLRAAVVAVFARVLNARRWGSGWRVDLEGLDEGEVRVVLSVLYQPYAEIDLDEPYGARPEDGYFPELQKLMSDVRDELDDVDPDHARHEIVTTADQLDS